MKKAFIFPGQGSQSIGMGKGLYDRFIVARDVFDEVNDTLSQDLSGLMFEGDAEELTKTENAQPAIMAVGMATIRVLESETGKKIDELVDCVAGHSLGEYTALCAAGALTVRQTAMILKERGWAMAKAAESQPGGMAAILGLPIEKVREILTSVNVANQICVVANDNCPGQSVISGHNEILEEAIAACRASGAKKAVRLAVFGAAHSPLMSDAADRIQEILKDTDMQSPLVPVVSNVTAQFETAPDTIKDLLVQQVIAPVRWTESVQYMKSQGVEEYIECGNGTVLTGLVKRIAEGAKIKTLNSPEAINGYLHPELQTLSVE